ncbi:hypothetical protein D3C80_1778600 [compost metagenome]
MKVLAKAFVSASSQCSKFSNAAAFIPVSIGFTKQKFLLRLSDAGQGETSTPLFNSFSTYIRGISATPCPAMTAAIAIS